jgi:hypothetical protein
MPGSANERNRLSDFFDRTFVTARVYYLHRFTTQFSRLTYLHTNHFVSVTPRKFSSAALVGKQVIARVVQLLWLLLPSLRSIS